MSDLIKREDAIKAVLGLTMYKGSVPMDSVIYHIKQAPTIDAVSVVHGKWKPNTKIGWGETWVCSICGEKTTSSVMGYPRYNYCPMCGAKMKGADEEDN